jgi:hypothetical protein
MSTDATYRAQEAARLSDEPLLVEALDLLMARATTKLMEFPSTAHEERWLLCCEMKVIRGFRDHLRATILNGQDAARPRPAVA